MGKENTSIKTKDMKDNSKMGKEMVMELIIILKDVFILDYGKMIINMGLVLKNISMVMSIKDSIRKTIGKDKEP